MQCFYSLTGTAMPAQYPISSDNFAPVTPANSNLASATRAIYVGTAGNINVVPSAFGSAGVVLTGIAAGSLLPISVVRISSTDTTASNIFALY